VQCAEQQHQRMRPGRQRERDFGLTAAEMRVAVLSRPPRVAKPAMPAQAWPTQSGDGDARIAIRASRSCTWRIGKPTAETLYRNE
jgi:hypothetical protein